MTLNRTKMFFNNNVIRSKNSFKLSKEKRSNNSKPFTSFNTFIMRNSKINFQNK